MGVPTGYYAAASRLQNGWQTMDVKVLDSAPDTITISIFVGKMPLPIALPFCASRDGGCYSTGQSSTFECKLTDVPNVYTATAFGKGEMLRLTDLGGGKVHITSRYYDVDIERTDDLSADDVSWQNIRSTWWFRLLFA